MINLFKALTLALMTHGSFHRRRWDRFIKGRDVGLQDVNNGQKAAIRLNRLPSTNTTWTIMLHCKNTIDIVGVFAHKPNTICAVQQMWFARHVTHGYGFGVEIGN